MSEQQEARIIEIVRRVCTDNGTRFSFVSVTPTEQGCHLQWTCDYRKKVRRQAILALFLLGLTSWLVTFAVEQGFFSGLVRYILTTTYFTALVTVSMAYRAAPVSENDLRRRQDAALISHDFEVKYENGRRTIYY